MPYRPAFRESSRRMALCALMAALSVVVLSAGSLIPMATFACPMLAMFLLIPALDEYGAKPALLQYAAAAILALLLAPDKELALFFVFLGYYPVLRPYLDRIPHLLPRSLVKCGLFTAAMLVMYLLILQLLRLQAVVEEFAAYSAAAVVGLLALGNVTFLVLDRALVQMTRIYQLRLRRRLFR